MTQRWSNEVLESWAPVAEAMAMPQTQSPTPQWEPTPWWHWRRLLRQAWRKDIMIGNRDNPEPVYEYQTHGQRARNILEEKFNVGTEQSPPHWPGRSQSDATNKGAGLPAANHGHRALGSQAR